tara:strand:+ start:102 stop:1040 length:939 start_codon:yes stop_codon:yes gene_type:complete
MIKDLILGNNYSKKELVEILNEETLKTSREGIFNCKNSLSTLFFVTLDKSSKEENLHYNDFFEEDFFHWDSQNKQHINTSGIKKIVNGETTTHLFCRITNKTKNLTNPFVYCGILVFESYDKNTSNPVHIIFQNIDYDDNTENEDLIDIYLWTPQKYGKNTSNFISKKGIVSDIRKRKYIKPNKTERRGLVTSRVGQGYYRQQILEKWNGTCPVTKSKIKSILISSHILPWSQCNDEQKLDVDNGILLSPNVDSLFDKYLISFSNDGFLIKSSKITDEDLNLLGVDKDVQIPINDGMKKYLEIHRKKLNEFN